MDKFMVLEADAGGNGGASGEPAPTPAPPLSAAPPPSAPTTELPKFHTQLSKTAHEKHGELLKSLSGKSLDEVFDEFAGFRAQASRTIVMPDPATATPEEITRWRERMGMPSDPAGYELPTNLEVKEEAYKRVAERIRKDGLQKTIASEAFEAGTTKQQGARIGEIVGAIGRFAREEAERLKTQAEQTFPDRLLAEVGNDEAVATETMNLAKKHLLRYNDPDLLAAIDADPKLGTNPRFYVRLAAIERTLGEPRITRGGETPRETIARRGRFGGQYSRQFNDEKTRR